MPIHVDAEIRILSQTEFSAASYTVMDVLFGIHNEIGRLFDEKIYQAELQRRIPGSRIEVPVKVSFEGFCHAYSLDFLTAGGAFFELKTVESLHPRHRSQLLNYLLMLEATHGKLVNLRAAVIEHEFVNTSLTRADRTSFELDATGFDGSILEKTDFAPWFEAVLRDWGTGLDTKLYEEAILHFHGRPATETGELCVLVDGRRVGLQIAKLIQPSVGLEVTALEGPAMDRFENHIRRFVSHTSLNEILWVNVHREIVSFKTIANTQSRASRL